MAQKIWFMFTILQAFEILACVTGFIYWQKIKNTHWKWFVFYLLFIVLAEVAGLFLSDPKLRGVNSNFYNLLVIPIEFLFFYWLFYKTFVSSRYVRLPFVGAGIYMVSWGLDIFQFSKFYSFSYTVGSLVLSILILCFFAQLMTRHTILKFSTNMMFWVCLGLLLFFLLCLPYYGLHNTLAYIYPELIKVYAYIVYSLDCFMYLMFTIAFIWGKPNSEISSS
jgi:hypothetical protein